MTELQQMLQKFLNKETFQKHFHPEYMAALYEYVQYVCLITQELYKTNHKKNYKYKYDVNDQYHEPYHVLIFLWSMINGDGEKTFYELPEKERLGILFFLFKYEQKAHLCRNFKRNINFDKTALPSKLENIIQCN